MKLIGKKLGMTSMFDEDGASIPVTLIELGPCSVTQIKTVENDGYAPFRSPLADGMKEKNLTKALWLVTWKNPKPVPFAFSKRFAWTRSKSTNSGKTLTVEKLDEKFP